MKTTKARLDWREGRRRRAWELKEQGWKQQDIAAALGVTSGAVSQWVKRARSEGVEEGLRAHPAPGPAPKLTPEQLAQLPALLDSLLTLFRSEARTPIRWGLCGRASTV
jgi:transposase